MNYLEERNIFFPYWEIYRQKWWGSLKTSNFNVFPILAYLLASYTRENVYKTRTKKSN